MVVTTGETYGMTAEQADLAMGMLIKTIQEQQEEIVRLDQLAFHRWSALDLKNRVVSV